MLSLRQIDDIGTASGDIIANTEQSILNDMSKRIAKLNKSTSQNDLSAIKYESISGAKENINKELSRMLVKAPKEIAILFEEYANKSIDTDNKIYKKAGIIPIKLKDNPWLSQILQAGYNKTFGTFENITRTTAYASYQQFIKALDLAHNEVLLGSKSYQQAIIDAIKSLTKNGLETITYPTGHRDYLDVATRRAIMTGIAKTCAEIQLANMDLMGIDLIEVTAHAGARTGSGIANHSGWQGKIYKWNH